MKFGHDIMKSKDKNISSLFKECECGCGQLILTTGSNGVIRRFVLGHNRSGVKNSEETKMKISIANKGHECSEETKMKISIANKGHECSEETKEKISKSNIGKKKSKESIEKMCKSKKGKKLSEECKIKIGNAIRGKKRSEEHKRRTSNSLKGHKVSEETRLRMSIAQRGEKSHQWKGGISFGKYCPKFNRKVKQKNRDKYMNMCFLCGMTEEENGRRLDVHHVDYNKLQGCDEYEWRLVPLCRSCHAKTNSDREMYERRICIFLEVI